jgi:hypothetical protein
MRSSNPELFALSVEDAAKAVSLSPFTIRAYIRRGILPVQRAGRRVMVPVDALRALVLNGAPALRCGNSEQESGTRGGRMSLRQAAGARAIFDGQ